MCIPEKSTGLFRSSIFSQFLKGTFVCYWQAVNAKILTLWKQFHIYLMHLRPSDAKSGVSEMFWMYIIGYSQAILDLPLKINSILLTGLQWESTPNRLIDLRPSRFSYVLPSLNWRRQIFCYILEVCQKSGCNLL